MQNKIVYNIEQSLSDTEKKQARDNIGAVGQGELAGITSIGNDAFNGCTSLALTELPAGITSIGSSAFNGCTSLAIESLVIPPGVMVYNSNSFSNCPSIVEIDLNNVISISNLAMSSQKFKNIRMEKMTTIGNGAFYGVGAKFYLPDEPPTINGNYDYTFSKNNAQFYLSSNDVIDRYLSETKWSQFDSSRFHIGKWEDRYN